MVTRLSFQDAPPNPVAPTNNRVGSIAFGPPTKPPTPASNTSAPKTISPLQFSNTPAVSPSPPSAPPAPAPLFGVGVSKAAVECIVTFRKRYGDAYYTQHHSRVDVLLNRLLPVRADVVASWGTKTLERSRSTSTEISKLVASYVATDVAATLEKVADAMKPRGGFLSKFRSGDVSVYVPHLAAMQPSIQQWIDQAVSLTDRSRGVAADLMLKLATLTAMHETVGDPPDNTLSQLLFNRRSLLQQGTLQTELMVKQIEDLYNQLLDLQMRVDQVLNITIPAYTAAQTRK